MSEKKLIKNYLNKIKKLREHNNLYFNKNSPKIPDEDYDKLKIEILDLEKKYPSIISKDSPSLNVGFKPSKNFKKLKHRVQMLSLSNVFSKEDLINFEKKILNFLDFKKDYKIEYSVEPKIDGISASLTYKKGELIYGVSRGDGKEGELITENLKTIKDIPQKISHFSFSILILSILLNGIYSEEFNSNMKVGDELKFIDKTIKFKGINFDEKDNYKLLRGDFEVIESGKNILNFNPEIRIYNQPVISTSEADIKTNLFNDNFIVFTLLKDNEIFNVRYQHKPFMIWIWISIIMLAFGGTLAVIKYGK